MLSRGTTDEGSSFITHEQYEIIKSRPQIATTADGQALISPEMITGFNANPDCAPVAIAIHVPSRRLSNRVPGASRDAIG